ncbi:MAG: LysR family transcriptional regulator [Hyphomicrobiales bacterium]|nr:LysR family transcriptional regulator [Hyphomicrobiales bacterium]
MLGWEHMPYFLAVARSGSLRAAAAEFNTTHGKINRQIGALETSYGVQLFSRSQTGLNLTPAGETLLPLAEDMEDMFIDARRYLLGLDRKESGIVRISMMTTFACEIMAPILAKLSKRYPDINIEVSLTDGLENLSRLESDISIRLAFDIEDDVVARKLYPVAIGTYASQAYLDEYLNNASPNGQGLHWIGAGQGLPANWVDNTPFPKAEIRHNIAETMLRLQLIRHGYGMAILPAYVSQKYPELVQVPGTSLALGRSVWILLHENLLKTTRVRRFADFISNELTKIKPMMQGGIG